jgi:hypothetical protein
MTNAYRHFFLCVTVCLVPTVAWADVIVNTSLGLTELQIAPSTGTLDILSPVTALTFAQALDSLGGSDAQTNSVDNAATSANAATSLANASGAASAPALTGSVAANVNLPGNFDGFANSTGQSSLSGKFEITGTNNPVDVTFNAFLSVNQFLQTTGAGQSASSEIIFTLLLPDLGPNPVLALDNPLAIGPDQVLSYGASPTLTTSMSLQPNTPYSFVASLDAESNGVSVTPEPSSLALAFTLVGILAVLGRLTTKPRPDGRG